MDGKRTKRRKVKKTRSNGRSEEKPKVPEVTSEKEEKDRLEAASVLSSLMFLPPKSPDQVTEKSVSEQSKCATTTSDTVTQFSKDSGIPVQQGRQSRGRSTDSQTMDHKVKKNLIQTFPKDQSDKIIYLPVTNGSKNVKLEMIQEKQNKQASTNRKSNESVRLPATFSPDITVNKMVASALRQAVSSNMKSPSQNADEKDKSGEHDQCSEDQKLDAECASSKKKDATEMNLPLKKRRLIGMEGAEDDNLPSRLESLNSGLIKSSGRLSSQLSCELTSQVSTSEESKVLKGEGYCPLKIDPRTSLLVLQDVRVALTPDEDGDLPLHLAVVHKNLELVKKFIDIMAMSGKTVDRFNKLQQTPLHLSILVNEPEIVKALLSAGANPNLLDRNGCTSLHLAVRKQFHGCLNVVYSFTNFPVIINSRDYEGYPPLHTCVELDDLESMQYLVEREADINVQDGKAGRSVLFYATEYHRVKMVEFLLDYGANADLQNYAGITALMTAQSANMEEISQMLKISLDMYSHDDSMLSSSKKVPIPRIPSKSSLTIGENSKMRSFSRQSSVSSNSSPIDLSVHRNAELLPAIKQKTQRRMKKEIRVKEEKEPKSYLKSKHASLLAALQGKFGDKSVLDIFEKGDNAKDDKNSPAEYIISKEEILGKHKGTADKDDHSENSENETDTCNEDDSYTDGKRLETDSGEIVPRRDKSDKVQVDLRKAMSSKTEHKSAKVDENFKLPGEITVLESQQLLMSHPWLLSQQLLASQPHLASNFSDLLQSMSGPLKSLDVLELMKQILPQQPGILNSNVTSQISKPVVEKSLAPSVTDNVNNNIDKENKDEDSLNDQNTSRKIYIKEEPNLDSPSSNALVSSEADDEVSNGLKDTNNEQPDDVDMTVVNQEDVFVRDGGILKDSGDKHSVESTSNGDGIAEAEEDDNLVIDEEEKDINEKKDADNGLVIGESSECGNEANGHSSDMKTVDSNGPSRKHKLTEITNETGTKKAKFSEELPENVPVSDKGSKPSEPVARLSAGSTTSATSVSQSVSQSLAQCLSTESLIFSPLNSVETAKLETVTVPTSPANLTNVIPITSSVVGNKLKKGTSHTIFYKHGQDLKPVRILIDDTEQSSLVLQKMLQATQLNVNVKSMNDNESDSSNTTVVNTSTNLISVMSSDGDVSSLQNRAPLIHAIGGNKTIIPIGSLTSGVFMSSPQFVSVDSATTLTVPAASSSKPAISTMRLPTKISPYVVSNLNLTTVTQPLMSVKANVTNSFQNAYIESIKSTLHAKENKSQDLVSDKMVNNTKDVSKSNVGMSELNNVVVSENSSQDSSKDFGKSDVRVRTSSVNKVWKGSSSSASEATQDAKNRQNKAASTVSEGTLTKVNPDIKNRLSKALNCPQRKLSTTNGTEGYKGLNKVEKTVLGNMGTVSESRQQL